MLRSKRVANGLAIATLLLIALLATAEPPPQNHKTILEPVPITAKSVAERQDQLGHASGTVASESSIASDPNKASTVQARSLGSAHPAETLTKKHIAGVKYEDRTGPGNH